MKKKILVLYHSRTGSTEKVAKALKAELGADIMEIKCTRYKGGWFRYLLAGYDSVTGRLPPVEVPDFRATNYDLVLLGSPIWTSYPALPLRAFLAGDRNLPTRVGLFLTFGGHSPPDKAVNFVSNMLPNPVEAALTLSQARVVNDDYVADMMSFIQSLSTTATTGSGGNGC